MLYTDGPALVVAGAGSGKTRVITYKLAYLIQQGLPPSSLFALTFTNKAAREMRQRVEQMLGARVAAQIRLGTFHSVFARIIRSHAHLIGYNQDYTIYDRSDSKTIVNRVIKELGLKDEVYKPSTVLNRISSAKNQLISPEAYAQNDDLVAQDRKDHFARMWEVYRLYQARCRESNAMDFDDLLYNFNLLLRDFPQVHEQCVRMTRYLLIDEYQDTNFSQFTIVRKLVQGQNRLFAVGDDAQSIYSFRGANLSNILNFQKIFPGAKIFRLEENYRSTRRIVELSNRLIEHNRDRIPKELTSHNEQGNKIRLNEHPDATAEADYVAGDIAKKNFNGASLSECAVLYRTNAQSRLIEAAMRKRGLPYVVYGGASFYARKEIKQVLYYLQILVNPLNTQALLHTLFFPRKGIGDKTIEKVQTYAAAASISPAQALTEAVKNPKEMGLTRAPAGHIADYLSLIADMNHYPQSPEAQTRGFAGWIEYIIKESGIAAVYSTEDPEDKERLKNLKELIANAKEWEEQLQGTASFDAQGEPLETDAPIGGPERLSALLSSFVQNISLITDLDQKDPEAECVHLMTIHAAKGLEFPYVYLCGLEDHLIPSQKSTSAADIEEERRLLYVAITRAAKECNLNYALLRRVAAFEEPTLPSRFIAELPPQLLEKHTANRSGILPQFNTYLREADSSDNSSPKSSASPRGLNYASSSHPASTPAHQPGALPYLPADGLKSIAPSAAPKEPLSRPLIDPRVATQAITLQGVGSYRVGDRVSHPRFGTGTVLTLSNEGANSKAVVRFDADNSERTLLLRFARLTTASR